jgi:hypothetical protein
VLAFSYSQAKDERMLGVTSTNNGINAMLINYAIAPPKAGFVYAPHVISMHSNYWRSIWIR